MSLARAHRLVGFVHERGAAPSSHRAALIDARVTNLAIDVGAGYFERSAPTRREPQGCIACRGAHPGRPGFTANGVAVTVEPSNPEA